MKVEKILSGTGEWIELLGPHLRVQERYEKLFAVFPQLWLWEPEMRRELVLLLQTEYGLDFGIQFSIPGGEVIFPFVTIPIITVHWDHLEKKAAV